VRSGDILKARSPLAETLLDRFSSAGVAAVAGIGASAVDILNTRRLLPEPAPGWPSSWGLLAASRERAPGWFASSGPSRRFAGSGFGSFVDALAGTPGIGLLLPCGAVLAQIPPWQRYAIPR
jgi:hypothetical protein